ncbi:hypothetical protein [Okeania sp. KiyG1]|uniref:hypothetical protein n=1 Tax=Okeania sp. KiyG1 TaxID=2720165 RepID=UPI0019243A10|nr:hypothetical protein [Okeania sp. KiyG1]
MQGPYREIIDNFCARIDFILDFWRCLVVANTHLPLQGFGYDDVVHQSAKALSLIDN